MKILPRKVAASPLQGVVLYQTSSVPTSAIPVAHFHICLRYQFPAPYEIGEINLIQILTVKTNKPQKILGHHQNFSNQAIFHIKLYWIHKYDLHFTKSTSQLKSSNKQIEHQISYFFSSSIWISMIVLGKPTGNSLEVKDQIDL